MTHFSTKNTQDDLIYRQQGVTLIELSIVLVIIALIIGASLKGRDLIEAARNKAILAEIGNYKIAVNSFYTKFDALPGDFTEATTYWSTGTIADGDGDGKIYFQNSSDTYEGYNAWQHLSNERMVNLPYDGTQTTSAATLDNDVPKAKTGGGYFFAYGSFTNLSTDNVLALGTPMTPTTADDPDTIRLGATITAFNAHQIDSKSDDGNPVAGNIQSADADDASAEDCILNPENTYNIDAASKGCKMGFRVVTQ